ncbi:biotin transporter BioY [Planctomonas psychrotolerans]|uniref:biotin transporter BioY n=1 Tax=Planctomonas psychrotolerans TaxID=2528712 RepID=UPI00123C1C85|nr:biotin transporter BioY [Planctomonas psychrotolerans]
MTTAAALGSPTVLADRILSRSVTTDVTLVVAGAALTAGLAQVEVPMWPVPITGQTLAVMLVGASLGAKRGAMSLGLYLVLGVIGLPIFAGFTGGPLAVLKPSFGFIIGFVFAAALIGWLAERNWDRKALPALAGFFLASLVPFAFGLPYMAIVLGNLGVANDLGTVLAFGVYPFIIGGIAKWLIAAAALPLAWKGVRALDARKGE